MANPPTDFRPQGEPGSAGHEPTDTGIRLILIAGVVLVVLCIGTFFLLDRVMRGFRSGERVIEATRPPLFRDDRGLFPEPRLQENPHAELIELQKADQAALTSYGWIDRKTGVLRIPIERAMDIIVEKGLPQPVSESKPATTAPVSGDVKSKGKPGGGS